MGIFYIHFISIITPFPSVAVLLVSKDNKTILARLFLGLKLNTY